MPNSWAVFSGSDEVSMLPKGVSTFTLSPFCETLAFLAMRWKTMPQVTIAIMQRRTMIPIMTRMILSAPLPPVEGGGPGAIGCDATGAPVTAAPHLLQNFVPSASCAPHELQKAMDHLAVRLNGRV